MPARGGLSAICGSHTKNLSLFFDGVPDKTGALAGRSIVPTCPARTRRLPGISQIYFPTRRAR